MLGSDVLFEVLREEGIRYLFGNPGTTELPLMDAVPRNRDIEYILCLHESVAAGAAMGYAAVSGKVGVLNLHAAPGLAHAMGNIHNAWRTGIPLLVTAGQHDIPFLFEEPLLWGDLVSMARPLTKWSYEVRSAAELPRALARALKTAVAPPPGPVFLSLPRDVLMAEIDLPPRLRTPRSFAPCAELSALETLASMLAEAENPLFLAGDGISRAGAWEAAVAFAEAAGIAVRNEPLPGRYNFPSDHPLFLGPLPYASTGFREAFRDVDLALFVGVENQAPFSIYDGEPAVPADLRIVYLGADPWELAKNQPGELAILGDPKASLEALVDIIARSWTPAQRARAEERARRIRARTAARRQSQLGEDEGEGRESDGPVPVMPLLQRLRKAIRPGTIIVNEGVSAGPAVQAHLDYPVAGSYLGVKGGCLGYGASMAIGAKLGAPDRPVVAVSGDGAALYHPQAIWTAAHHRIPVTWLILNNSSYRILKLNLRHIGSESARCGLYPHTDLDSPPVDFAAIAMAFGVRYYRIDRLADADDVMHTAMQDDQPCIVEAMVDRGI